MQVNWLLQGQLTGSVPVASICAGVTQRAVGEKLCAISSQFVLTLGLEGGGLEMCTALIVSPLWCWVSNAVSRSTSPYLRLVRWLCSHLLRNEEINCSMALTVFTQNVLYWLKTVRTLHLFSWLPLLHWVKPKLLVYISEGPLEPVTIFCRLPPRQGAGSSRDCSACIIFQLSTFVPCFPLCVSKGLHKNVHSSPVTLQRILGKKKQK